MGSDMAIAKSFRKGEVSSPMGEDTALCSCLLPDAPSVILIAAVLPVLPFHIRL